MMTNTLYVTDLDGTLLDIDSTVSELSARMISDLVRDGANVTIATARTPATVVPLMRNVFTTLPAIVLTGAAMWDRQRERYLFPSFLDDDESARVLAQFRQSCVNPFIYTIRDDGVLHVYHNGEMVAPARQFMEERLNLRWKRFHLDLPEIAEAAYVPNTTLYFAMGRAENVYPLAETLRATTRCSVYSYLDIFHPDVAVIEVFGHDVSKAHAIQRLARCKGFDRIVVFGDSTNDIPMLQIADVAVAVENALPEVKRMAHVVIGRNCDNAVARFIIDDYYSSQTPEYF